MSGYADELWTWLYEPLRDLRDKCQREPEVSWQDRFAEFLSKLNLSDADSHPVTKALAERVEEETDPIAFLAKDDTETFVYQLVTEEAARQAPQPEPAAPQQPAVEQVVQPQPVKDPGAAAEQAVVAIGLPAALGVAPAPNLAATLATVLAYRLTGQAQPAGDEHAVALAAQVEKYLAANPVAGGEFYAVFGQDTPLAQQWITHQLTGHASELPTVQATTPATTAAATATSPDDVPFTMPELAEAILRDVPDADMLTHQEINDLIAEVMAEG